MATKHSFVVLTVQDSLILQMKFILINYSKKTALL